MRIQLYSLKLDTKEIYKNLNHNTLLDNFLFWVSYLIKWIFLKFLTSSTVNINKDSLYNKSTVRFSILFNSIKDSWDLKKPENCCFKSVVCMHCLWNMTISFLECSFHTTELKPTGSFHFCKWLLCIKNLNHCSRAHINYQKPPSQCQYQVIRLYIY